MKKGIVVAFDLDGTICDLNYNWLIQIEERKEFAKAYEERYYASRTLLMNPYLFLMPEDIGIIVTGRPKRLERITLEWLAKNGIFLSVHFVGKWKTSGYKAESVAKAKAKLLKELDVAVYLDDSPNEIRMLRNILGSEIVIIQVGSRIIR